VEASEISIFVDDFKLNTDVPSIIINDRIMLPIRAVAESLGCKVDWFEADQRIVVYSYDGGEPLISMHIDSSVARIYLDNGETGAPHVTLESPPVIVYDRALVPLRFIAETLGLTVDWNETTRNVLLYYLVIDKFEADGLVYGILTESQNTGTVQVVSWVDEQSQPDDLDGQDYVEEDSQETRGFVREDLYSEENRMRNERLMSVLSGDIPHNHPLSRLRTLDPSISNLTIPATVLWNGKMYTVTRIGRCAFDHTNLKSVEIPSSVTTIGGWAFSRNNLTSVTIPDSVTTIGGGAFSDTNLTSVSIPDSVAIIGDWAFANNTNLVSVTIPSSVTTIGSYAFPTSANTYVSNDNPTFSSADGILFNKDKTVLYSFSSATDAMIPDSVTTISHRAFRNANLASVTIPNSVTTIGDWAFANNNLTKITIPDSVTTIGHRAFASNNNLTEIWFDGNAPSVNNDTFRCIIRRNVIAYVHREAAGFPAEGNFWHELTIRYIQ